MKRLDLVGTALPSSLFTFHVSPFTGGRRPRLPPGYTRAVEQQLSSLLNWLGPHALLLALVLPPVIRVVGHWIPEELFMICMGVLAARSGSPTEAAALVGAVLGSHLAADQAVYGAGHWLRPRLGRFPRVAARLELVTARLASSPGALWGLVPARVLPLGRAAWLGACGVVAVPWRRFVMVDVVALLAHVACWCGLGWWLASDLARLGATAQIWKAAGLWMAAAALAALAGVIMWRRLPVAQLTGAGVLRRLRPGR